MKSSRSSSLTAYIHSQHFETNPFFTNTVLRKEFKYVAPTDPEALKKDEHGVSEADLEFNFERDVDVIVRHTHSHSLGGS